MVDSEPSSAVPHRNAATAFFEGVRDLLAQDPLLKDVPGTVTAEGVKEQLELEQGKSIRILLRRYGGDTVGIIVPLSGTVLDLKKAAHRTLSRKLKSPIGISW
jgi:hypothetical protein